MLFWREKNRDFESKGVDLYPPRGVTMGRGRECELPERNDSRNHFRKYSWKLWEVTSLPKLEVWTLNSNIFIIIRNLSNSIQRWAISMYPRSGQAVLARKKKSVYPQSGQAVPARKKKSVVRKRAEGSQAKALLTKTSNRMSFRWDLALEWPRVFLPTWDLVTSLADIASGLQASRLAALATPKLRIVVVAILTHGGRAVHWASQFCCSCTDTNSPDSVRPGHSILSRAFSKPPWIRVLGELMMLPLSSDA